MAHTRRREPVLGCADNPIELTDGDDNDGDDCHGDCCSDPGDEVGDDSREEQAESGATNYDGDVSGRQDGQQEKQIDERDQQQGQTDQQDRPNDEKDEKDRQETHENSALLALPELDFACDANSRRANTSRGKLYWSHRLYSHRDTREAVKVTYCHTRQQSEEAAQRLWHHERLLGFDMEWKPVYVKGKRPAPAAGQHLSGRDIKNNASVLQLACASEVVIFHMAAHRGNTADELVSPTLRKVLESPAITKTGVAICTADAPRLRQYLGIQPRGLFELSHFHRTLASARHDLQQLDQAGLPPFRQLVALAKLVQEHLGLPLFKGRVRTSNWSRADLLTAEQLAYAASDAYAGYMLFRVMEQQRQSLNPRPGIPAHASWTPRERPATKPVTPRVGTVSAEAGEPIVKEPARVNRPPQNTSKTETAVESDSGFEELQFEPRARVSNPRAGGATHSTPSVEMTRPAASSPMKENVHPSATPTSQPSYPSFCSVLSESTPDRRPRSDHQPSLQDRDSRQVLSALRGLVMRLAIRNKRQPEDIVSYSRLAELAIRRPASMQEMNLATLTQYSDLLKLCARINIDLFDYIRRYTPAPREVKADGGLAGTSLGVFQSGGARGRPPLKSLSNQT